MGWKRINGSVYFYRASRENGRHVTTYVSAARGQADVAAALAATRRTLRETRRSGRLEALSEDRTLSAWCGRVQAMADRAMVAAGFHQHKGQWRRRRRMTGTAELATTNGHADPLAPAVATTPGEGAGIEACREFLRSELGLFYRENVSFSAMFRAQICARMAPGTTLAQEALLLELEQAEAELAGDAATPLERLLVARVVNCYAVALLRELDGRDGPINSAHARLNAATLNLARVRKLALPSLQVNIAENQVNVNPM